MSSVVDEAMAMAGEAKHLGELVRRSRVGKGWSQGDLAARARMGQSEVSMLENGHKYVARTPLSTMMQLADALAENEGDWARILRAMFVVAGMEPHRLECVLNFPVAMSHAATAEAV